MKEKYRCSDERKEVSSRHTLKENLRLREKVPEGNSKFCNEDRETEMVTVLANVIDFS